MYQIRCLDAERSTIPCIFWVLCAINVDKNDGSIVWQEIDVRSIYCKYKITTNLKMIKKIEDLNMIPVIFNVNLAIYHSMILSSF